MRLVLSRIYAEFK